MEQNKFYQIKNITEHEYTLVGCDGSVIIRPIQDVDKSASVFTIQDAKDGDVLVCKDNGYNSYILFGEKNIYCWYNGQTEHFHPATSCSKLRKDATFYPATKEQRDTLFAKMKEAGYEWDAEKKELKKIEQLTTFEEAVKDLMNDYRDAIGDNDATTEEVKKHSEYLLSLIPQKPAWSEEDEREVAVLEAYIRSKDWSERHIDRALGIVDELVNKAKSLKPQNTWKPNDEQMLALSALADFPESASDACKKTAKELLEQLKKLKG